MRIARLTLLAFLLTLATAPAFASADRGDLPLVQRIFSHVKRFVVTTLDDLIVPRP